MPKYRFSGNLSAWGNFTLNLEDDYEANRVASNAEDWADELLDSAAFPNVDIDEVERWNEDTGEWEYVDAD